MKTDKKAAVFIGNEGRTLDARRSGARGKRGLGTRVAAGAKVRKKSKPSSDDHSEDTADRVSSNDLLDAGSMERQMVRAPSRELA